MKSFARDLTGGRLRGQSMRKPVNRIPVLGQIMLLLPAQAASNVLAMDHEVGDRRNYKSYCDGTRQFLIAVHRYSLSAQSAHRSHAFPPAGVQNETKHDVRNFDENA